MARRQTLRGGTLDKGRLSGVIAPNQNVHFRVGEKIEILVDAVTTDVNSGDHGSSFLRRKRYLLSVTRSGPQSLSRNQGTRFGKSNDAQMAPIRVAGSRSDRSLSICGLHTSVQR